jgi:hypothetical protein
MGKQFRVESQDGRWQIKVDGAQHGPFTSKVEAIAAAIAAAQRLAPEFQDRSQVLVQQVDRSYRALWTHGRDSIRPPVLERNR